MGCWTSSTKALLFANNFVVSMGLECRDTRFISLNVLIEVGAGGVMKVHRHQEDTLMAEAYASLSMGLAAEPKPCP